MDAENYPIRRLGWKSGAALRALDQVAAGVIITDADGRVVEMNRAAEHVLRRDDGLTVRQGSCLCSAYLTTRSLLGPSPSPPMGKPRPRSDACLSEGRGGRVGYMLTVAPLGMELAVSERPLALILVADPDARRPSEKELAEFFGLSPAEIRLTVALLAGRTMREVAADSGVRITTARTQ
jgi:hypothetical protein